MRLNIARAGKNAAEHLIADSNLSALITLPPILYVYNLRYL